MDREAGEDVGELTTGVDVVEFAGLDQRLDLRLQGGERYGVSAASVSLWRALDSERGDVRPRSASGAAGPGGPTPTMS